MLTEAEKQEILKMGQSRKGPVEIAEKLGVSAQRVARFMSLAWKQGLLPDNPDLPMVIYSDDRPGGIYIKSKSRLAFELIECEGCGRPTNIDIKAATMDVTYRARCESCGLVHAFVRLNSVLIVGVPSDVQGA